jgi:hypothetical protein
MADYLPRFLFFVEGFPLSNYPLKDWVLSHTGGDAVSLIAIACDRSGSIAPLKSQASPEVASRSRLREPQEALALIQSTFGLSITALAAVLRVERPTIYSWLRSTATPTLANSQRIERVANLAEHWLSLTVGQPLKDIRLEVLSGKSLLDLLLEEHLRTFSAETAMRELHKRLTGEPPPHPSLSEIARSRGISKDSSEFDVVTGRRFSEQD